MKIEDIEKLLQLKKENPDMDIIFKCDPEIYAGDDEGCFVAEFIDIEKSFYAEYGEKYYLDESDLKNVVEDNYDEDEESRSTKIKEFIEKIRQEKIVIWIGV